ncbi:MAG: caspase family protein [Hyphomonadaceae bacterium]|nr:caspase family protein [Hyphomonadaceae bacterium]
MRTVLRTLTVIAALSAILAGASAGDSAQAQSTPGKFALLVAVGEYASPPAGTARVPTLNGPPNDVALMRNLLRTQYGFADADIVTIAGPQATRQGIIAAFRRHLVTNAQRRPGSQIVFYFSGHGSTITDRNGDEGDGVDETLVAYNSRLPGQRDITDDEIGGLFSRLSAHTNNTVFILDSCHSGTGVRDIDDPVSRELPPARPLAPAVGAADDVPEAASAFLPRRDSYILLSGSMASERSREGPIPAANGAVYGFFTYYLAQTLSRSPGDSYEHAIRDVRTAVLRVSPAQHPQVEGAIERVVFGREGDRVDPFIRIREAPAGGALTLDAGAAYGLREGSIVAVYAANVTNLTGEAGKIADARITSVSTMTATAQILGQPSRAITTEDKVAIVSLGGVGDRLRVRIDDIAGSADVFAPLSAALRENLLIEITSVGSPWDASVRRGCLVSGRLVTARETQPPACTPAYYLAPATSDQPLFNAWVTGLDAAATAARLAEFISNKARQENLRALDNARSPMRRQLTIAVQRVTVTGTGPEAVAVDGAILPNTGLTQLRVGDYVRLVVTNNTNEDLYVGLVQLGAGGSISVLPFDEQLRRGLTARTQVFRVGGRGGTETYKLIATTRPGVNFNVLEQPGVTRDVNASPLQWLLDQSANTNLRELDAVGVDLSSWGTAQVDVVIVP